MSDWTPIASRYDPLKAGSIDGTDNTPHDRAIYRAMSAKYKPNKSVVGNPENTIFVGRLSPNTDEEMLENLFKKHGEIKRLRLVRNIVTGISRCYAFIEYTDSVSANKAERENKTLLDEKEIYVDFECQRTLKGWIPRRLGGGISGKKESGQLRFGGKNRPFKKPFNINSVNMSEEGTFRDRLRAVERGEHPEREKTGKWDRSRTRDNQREQYPSRDRHRRSRSTDRDRYSRDRSERSPKRNRSRSRESSKQRKD